MTREDAKPPKVETTDLISSTVQGLVEGVSGLLASSKQERVLSVGQILQHLVAGNLLVGLKKDWDTLRERGKIKPDYEETAQHLTCLHEILEFLEKDIPDDVRFSALKKILFTAASEEKSKRDDALPHQYIRLCKGLSCGAVLVMLTEYSQVIKHPPEGSFPRSINVQGWRGVIGNLSGLEYTEMVGLFEKELIDKNILTRWGNVGSTLTTLTQHGRLTNLGWGLCEFINHADSLWQDDDD